MKAALLADLHFGVKRSDTIWKESQLRFFKEQFVPELKEQNIDTVIICGDVFDTRQAINVQTENDVLDLFKETFKDLNIHVIVGNHDMYHTTSTFTNSLKAINLLPNVTVYETPTEVMFDNMKVLMLPWITDYSQFDEMILNHYEYAFAHLDIVGFDMGGGLSTSGLTIKDVLSKFKHTYSGHYHSRCIKKFEDSDITYIGSPYQITRIDKRQPERGYGILDFETGKFEWKDNKVSIRFIDFTYPNVDEKLVPGNVIDIAVPYEFQNETKKIYDLAQKLNKLNPAYPVNTNNEDSPTKEQDIKIDIDSLNLTTMFKSFLEQYETVLDKEELYQELIKLYDMFKGAAS